jgi:beta-N-acetylhexosaminidase
MQFNLKLPSSILNKLTRIKHTWSIWLLLFAMVFSWLSPIRGVKASQTAQTSSMYQEAQQLLDSLTPEERVGQLFLVSFQGMQVDSESKIYDLITNHHIGGVVLKASNDNFTDSSDAMSQILTMTRQLQLDRWSTAQQPHPDPTTGLDFIPAFIPLFIGISQEGDGFPNDQILTGLTQLPNEMAMGATWDPNLAATVGNVLGQELSALGINLLLGPSLDVLADPRPLGANTLGTRTFGGDPYWVGLMGQAFISSLHQGSNGKLAVIAKHFPGIGAADRLPEEEVATVRKSLEQLENFDLVPFFNVTGNVATSDATTDGLLVSHIRYQGFQGNIRATTRPISLDLQAFSQLMSLPSLTNWRNSGGVMMCDDLGTEAVRRFFDLTNPNQPFDARRVALNAFLAGNDLLYIGNITSSDDPDSYTTAVNILAFFAQRYREDPAFAKRVDESVLRILALKYRQYKDFTLETIVPPLDGVATLGKSNQVVFNVASKAATLISPSIADLDTALPDSPNPSDRIVFITDARSTQQCSQCQERSVLAVDALQQSVIRLYGPQAGGTVRASNLVSYSFDELDHMLNNDPNAIQVEKDLRRAQWVIFSMLDLDSNYPANQALYRFLAQRPDLFQGKRLIVFAFNAPYFLDATDISKLTAYYGLYSKAPSFIDVAARLLFKELRPEGSLPVSVAGTGYDLISATMPDPNQVIPLTLDIPSQAGTTAIVTATPEPLPTPAYQIGDLIPVKAGVILDHNGHPVPDGTPVTFIVTSKGDTNALPQAITTKSGIATTKIQIPDSGTIEIRVESEPAKKSDILHFEIPPGNGVVASETPTVQPTLTPSVTSSPTAPPTAITTATNSTPPRPNFFDWLIAITIASVIGFLSFRITAYMGLVRWGVRGGFLAVIGGLLAYSLLVIGSKGSHDFLQSSGGWGVILITLIGSVTGVLIAWLWRTLINFRLRDHV